MKKIIYALIGLVALWGVGVIIAGLAVLTSAVWVAEKLED